MSNLLTTFELKSPEKLYSSLVNFTHNFHSYYVSRPHIKRRFEYHAWTLDERILQAEKKMVEDGVSFQGDRPLTVSTSTSHPEMI
ncbi:hypothetical protein Hamer_G013609 [Homarus americanus]|uniref:Uncharacterized protein n=1 Tax=Homarus americanus TaxID=6706 RepID=A0A8J5K387_HOMAM|nr:hypothetical protein Hamer_G013609 [Homarus americanus]